MAAAGNKTVTLTPAQQSQLQQAFLTFQSTGVLGALGMSCTIVQPPPATGACCLTNGTCQTLTQAQCTAQGGTYKGDNVSCASVTCTGNTNPPPGSYDTLVGDASSQYPGLPVGSDGWTIIPDPISLGGVIIYVSSSTGNDANTGLSSSVPKRTISAGYAALRNGKPDQLLLKAGDIWDEAFPFWAKSGQSVTAPMVIGSYGTGVRPLLRTGTARGFGTASLPSAPVNHITMVSIDLWAHTNDGTSDAAGIDITCGNQSMTDFLFEDVRVRQYAGNVTVQGIEQNPSNFKFRRCILADAIKAVGDHRSTGIIVGHTDGVLVEECFLDHNGWSETIPNGYAIDQSHNAYINPDNTTGVTFRHNIVARASANGIRSSGALCEANLCLANPINLTVGPDTRIVRNNVILDSRDINGDPRGMGIDGTIGANVQIYGNIIAHQVNGTGNTRAMTFNGVYDGLDVHDNIVYKWIQVVNNQAPAILFAGSCTLPARIHNNDFQQYAGAIYQHNPNHSASEVFTANRYWSTNPTPFLEPLDSETYDQWLVNFLETGSTMTAISYPNAGRDIASYQTLRLGTPGLAGFCTDAREQRKGAWLTNLMALSVINYIRNGFGLPNL